MTARIPTPRAVRGNLIVAADRTRWACWRLDRPYDYATGTPASRQRTLDDLETLIAALPPQASFASTETRVPEHRLAEQARAAVGSHGTTWANWCTTMTSGGGDQRERSWWLTCRVDDPGAAWWKPWRTRQTRAGWELAAEHTLRMLGPTAERFRPATSQEILWLWARSLRRHSTGEPEIGGIPAGLTPTRAVDLDIVERARRIETVSPEWGDEAHQAGLVIADLPREVQTPGGAEWLWHLQQMPFPVDWAVTVDMVDNDQAIAKAIRRGRQILGQWDEQAAADLGAPNPELATDGHDIEALREQLAETRQPQARFVTVVQVGADTPDELQARASTIGGLFPGGHFALVRPAGSQMECALAGVPGHPTHRRLPEYQQIALPDGVAAGAPFCGSPLGDTAGVIVGEQTGGSNDPVFLDLPAGPQRRPNPQPASIGVCGQSGSGKTVLLMNVAAGLVAGGAQVTVIDRTRLPSGDGEWARLADAMPGTSQVVNVLAGDVTLDPIATAFTAGGPDAAAEAAATATGYLRTLAGVTELTSPAGAAIAKAANTVIDRDQGDGRVSDIVAELAVDAGHSAAARTVVDTLEIYRHNRQVATVLNRDARPLDLTAGYTVLWVPDLTLPDPGVADPDDKQLASQGLVLLLVAATHAAMRANPRRFSPLVLDEAWAVLNSPMGEQLIETMARDSRKRGSGLLLSTQSPTDIPDRILGQLPTRAVFNVEEEDAAMRFLKAPADSDVRRILSTTGGGLCAWRDHRGRIGQVQTCLPVYGPLRDLVDYAPQFGDQTATLA